MLDQFSLNREQLPVLTYLVLPEFLVASLIALRLSIVWRISGFAAFAYMTAAGLSYTMGDGKLNYIVGGTFTTNVAAVIYLLFLINPIEQLRHERDTVCPGEMPFLKRIYWTLSVKLSLRFVGYNAQVANVPPPPTRRRGNFAIVSFLRAVYFFLLLDLCQAYIYLNPLFSFVGPDTRPITAQGHIFSCLSVLAWSGSLYCSMNWPYYILAAVATSTGLSEPCYWPDMFGKWSDAYTIRRFWGRTWHQLMRRFLVPYGKLVSSLLGFRPGTAGSRYTQLFVAFIVSGLVHCGGDYMVNSPDIGAYFLFFIAQAVAITCEDGVIWLAEKAGIRNGHWVRVVGYTWVFWWFSITLPPWIDWGVKAGLGLSQASTFSVTRNVLNALSPEIEAGIQGLFLR